MAHLFLTGRVIPERGVVEFKGNPKVMVQLSGGRLLELDVQIVMSQIFCHVFVRDGWFSYEEIGFIFESVSRICADSIGFSNGCGYEIEILTLSNMDSGERLVFGVEHKNVNQYEMEKSLSASDVALLSYSNHQLRRALADLRECIRSYEDVAFFAYRAMDTVKQDFRDDRRDKEKDLWERMRSNLNIDEFWLKEVATLSHGPRHGKFELVDLDCRALLIRRAWVVVDRFSAWLKGGRVPLDKEKYPILYSTGIFL